MALILRDCEASDIKQITNDIGNFDYAYEFYCQDETIMQSLIDWMSTNCRKNFIITRTMCHIVAGGCTDNESAWKEHKFTLKKMRFSRTGAQYRAIGPSWRVKMHQEDHTAFTLRWLDTE